MKTKLILFLVVISSMVFFYSCETIVDREFTVEYVYKNKTNKDVGLVLMGNIREFDNFSDFDGNLKTFSIVSDSEIMFETTFSTTEKKLIAPKGMLVQNNLLGDSLKVVCDELSSVIIYHKDKSIENNIFYEENYIYEELGSLSFRYTYVFK